MSLPKYNYYSISEAADELSKQLTETVTSKDIVKQAREGRLAIAVSVAPNALCRYWKTINDTPSKIESEYKYGMLYEFLSEDHPRLDGYNFTLYISPGTLANDLEFDPLDKFISAKSGMDMNWVPMLKASPESSADITLLRSTEVQKWGNADKKGVSYDSTDIVSAPFIEYEHIQNFISRLQTENIQPFINMIQSAVDSHPEVKVTRKMENQLIKILKSISELGYTDFHNIPYGGKTKVLENCAKDSSLFPKSNRGNDNAFTKAWKNGLKLGLFNMEHSHIYAGK